MFCIKGGDESRSANLTLTSKEGLGNFLPFHGDLCSIEWAHWGFSAGQDPGSGERHCRQV